MTDKRKFSINLFLLVLLILLASFQVFLLNRYSTSGDIQTSLIADIKTAESENSRLTQKLASNSAVAAISVKATAMGFKGFSPLSLAQPLPVAYNLPSSL